MNHSQAFAERVAQAILASDKAPVIFDRAETSLKKFLAGDRGKAAIAAIQEIVESKASKYEPTAYLNQLEDYAFLLPKADRDAALNVFNECGDVTLAIRCDATGSKVKLQKNGPDIPIEFRATANLFTSGQVSGQFTGNEQETKPASNSVKHSEPDREEETKPETGTDILAPKTKRKVAFMFPVSRDVNPHVVKGIAGQLQRAYDLLGRGEVPFFETHDTVIDRARNILATRFLEESDAEWSFWMDSDMIAPYGNPAWFKEKAEAGGKACNWQRQFLEINALDKLTSGPHKLVSALYVTRDQYRRLVAQPGLSPQDNGDTVFVQSLKRGPRTEYFEADWCGFGCVAVHRQVFLDVQKAFPELAPKRKGDPWNFFTGDANLLRCSEDVTFCRRAQQIGHKTMLDCSVMAIHVGNYPYLP